MKMIGNCFVLSFLVINSAAYPDKLAKNLIYKMTNDTTAWEDRFAAEDELATIPPKIVLQKLLPHIEKGMPSMAIWNSAGREIDKLAPVEWQIFYAVSRSWNRQVKKLPRNHGGILLLDLLNKTSSPFARKRLLDDLIHRWITDAEPNVVALLTNPKNNITTRITAGIALIKHSKKNYFDLIFENAKESKPSTRRLWYDLLVRYVTQTGIDPRVVQMGFDLIEVEQALNPNYAHASYFLAIKVGEYVGQKFQPDQKLMRYHNEHGLTDEFFEDTVKNALNWWGKNKEKIEQKLLQKTAQQAISPTNKGKINSVND